LAFPSPYGLSSLIQEFPWLNFINGLSGLFPPGLLSSIDTVTKQKLYKSGNILKKTIDTVFVRLDEFFYTPILYPAIVSTSERIYGDPGIKDRGQEDLETRIGQQTHWRWTK
jgi:hypothetical protein